jgi:hypothetical protein
MYIPFLNIDYVRFIILFTTSPTIIDPIIEKKATNGDWINGENIKTNIANMKNIVRAVILRYVAKIIIAIKATPKKISGLPLSIFIKIFSSSRG